MKTTLDLPDELLREVKLRAVLQGRTVKDLVTEFLRQGLGMVPPEKARTRKSSMVIIGKNGIPSVRCSENAPASRMSVEELLALEQESQQQEDLKRGGLSL